MSNISAKVTKSVKGIYTDITNFSLSEKLQNRLEHVTHDTDIQAQDLEKLKREYKLYALKNKGLQEIEKHFFNGEPKLHQNDLTMALREEIQRLMKIIETQQEIIEKFPFLHSSLSQLQKPTIVKTSHPVRLIRNYFRYRSEMKVYKETIRKAKNAEAHIVLEKSMDTLNVTRNGSTLYKSDFISEKPTHLQVGKKLRRYYYLADIPAYLSPYVFFRLLTSPLPFTLSIFIEPSPSSELLKKARQRLSVLEMQQNDRIKQGKARDQQIDKNIEEVTSFVDELVHEAEKGVLYSLYVQLEADDENELEDLHKQLQNMCGTMDITLNQYTFGHKKAFKNFLPFNEDKLNENRILQSTAASYLLPFVSKQLNNPDGVFMGVNAYNNSLVFIDPFTTRNNNINIFGVSGSGKSVTAKILMNRLYMRGVQIIVVDPEGEYRDLAESLGGEVISFTRDQGINPFYVSSTAESDILDHVSTLKTFFKFFIPPHHYDGAVLDEALIKLYDQGSPNFENLLELIKDHPMEKDLGVLATGSLRGVFNSTRRLALNNDIIVLDLHGLKKDEKREPAMYLLTSLIWNLLNKQSSKKRMMFIDEAHKLLVDPEVAVFYREVVKQARKRNVGVVSITQDVEDFLRNEYGKAIITNSETKILLKQSYATLHDIGTIYPMTDEEKKQLGHLGIGEVVLYRENEHARVNMIVLPTEQPLVFTSPEGTNEAV